MRRRWKPLWPRQTTSSLAFTGSLKGTRRPHSSSDLESTKALLATRTAELRESQAYLTKTDDTSHADVQRMVEGLNAQIFQLCAAVTDNVKFSRTRTASADARAVAEQRVGKTMAGFLHGSVHCDEPLWAQLALQATVNSFASWTITTWGGTYKGAQNAMNNQR